MTNPAVQHEHLYIGYLITLVAAVVCNLCVMAHIIWNPMRSPNIRYILMLTVALILEELFGLPYVYTHQLPLCEAAGAMKAYFQIIVVGVSLFMSVLAYLQIFGQTPNSWDWMNSPYAYLTICILAVVGVLPLADKVPGYGLVDERWCGASRNTRMALNFLVICYFVIYVCIFITMIIFSVMLFRLRLTGWGTLKRLWAGVGGYVCLTIVLWVPRIVLYRHVTSNDSFVVLNIFPNVSAVAYACLYVVYHRSLHRFEDSIQSDSKSLMMSSRASSHNQWNTESFSMNDQSFRGTADSISSLGGLDILQDL
jgi:hypothetical protein